MGKLTDEQGGGREATRQRGGPGFRRFFPRRLGLGRIDIDGSAAAVLIHGGCWASEAIPDDLATGFSGASAAGGRQRVLAPEGRRWAVESGPTTVGGGCEEDK